MENVDNSGKAHDDARILSCAAAKARLVRRPVSKALLLLRVALACAHSARPEECRRLIHEVALLCRGLKQPDSSLVTLRIALCWATLGELELAEKAFEEVIQVLNNTRGLIDGHGILFSLAQTFCEIGWVERALSLGDRLCDPLGDPVTVDVYQDSIFVAVSRHLMRSGNLVEALGTAERIRNRSARASEVADILMVCADRRDLRQQAQDVLLKVCSQTEEEST